MVNFGLLAAEIVLLVWGTPANFNRFRVLAALLHSTLVVGISETLRRWTEGATYIRQGGHHVGIGPHSSFWCFSQEQSRTILVSFCGPLWVVLQCETCGDVKTTSKDTGCLKIRILYDFLVMWSKMAEQIQLVLLKWLQHYKVSRSSNVGYFPTVTRKCNGLPYYIGQP